MISLQDDNTVNRDEAKSPVVNEPLSSYLEALIAKAECDYLRQLLAQNRGTINKSAEQAGISRRTLLRKMKQYQLNKNDFKQ